MFLQPCETLIQYLLLSVKQQWLVASYSCCMNQKYSAPIYQYFFISTFLLLINSLQTIFFFLFSFRSSPGYWLMYEFPLTIACLFVE